MDERLRVFNRKSLREVENELHYSVVGTGRPVVFLHGFLESSSMWKILKMDDHFQAIYIDLPGHGRTASVAHITMADMAQSLINVIHKLGVKTYDLVGHSMGGYVGLEVRKMDPRCQKMVLLNSNFWTDSQQKKEDRKRVATLVKTRKEHFIREAIPHLFMHPKEHQKEVEQLIAEASQMTAESIAAASIAMSERWDHTSSVDDPNVCLIQGKYDAVVPVGLTEEKINGLKLKYFCLEAGHMSHIECTSEVRLQLQHFLT